MPKAVIAQRIYLDADISLQKKILKELTYFIPRYRDDIPPEVVCNGRIVNDNCISIPAGRIDLIPKNYEIIDRRVNRWVDWPEFNFTLRPEQQEIYEKVEGSCLIHADPAWGKTFTGIAIARKLKQKTLVVVHTKYLMEQWAEEIEKTINLKPGIIGGGVVNKNGPIVVTNIQKLTRLAKSDFNKEFGTVIVDEAHHTPASTFADTVDAMFSVNKIGLTASKRRKDGKHIMFSDYFGKDVFIANGDNALTPIIHRIQSPFVLRDGSDPWAIKVNELCDNEEYQKFISIIASIYADKGHKVLATASRTSLLEACHRLTERSVCVIGSLKDRKTEVNKIYSGDADIVYGSENIWAEGISVNPLSCLILTTPMNNEPRLEQIIGRVTRKMDGKIQPVIVDIRHGGNTAFVQGQLRDGYYLDKGYQIIDV